MTKYGIKLPSPQSAQLNPIQDIPAPPQQFQPPQIPVNFPAPPQQQPQPPRPQQNPRQPPVYTFPAGFKLPEGWPIPPNYRFAD